MTEHIEKEDLSPNGWILAGILFMVTGIGIPPGLVIIGYGLGKLSERREWQKE